MAIGSEFNDIVHAQNVQLFASVEGTVSETSSPTDRIMLMRDVRLNPTLPWVRVDHGLTASYGFGAPDVICTAMISGSLDLLDQLQNLVARSSVGIPPLRRWKIVARDDAALEGPTPPSNLATKARHILMTCVMTDFTWAKTDGPQGLPAEASISLLLIHGKTTSADGIDNVFHVAANVA